MTLLFWGLSAGIFPLVPTIDSSIVLSSQNDQISELKIPFPLVKFNNLCKTDDLLTNSSTCLFQMTGQMPVDAKAPGQATMTKFG